MERTGKPNLQWSHNFAYAIGLLATDGSLSKDGRHIDFTSKDKIQVENFLKALGANTKIGTKKSGSGNISYRAQLGNKQLYNFLVNIGLTPRKSKTIGAIKIPELYLNDFIRGHFDGDGTFYFYWDARWKKSFMCYLELTSASESHLQWLQSEISRSFLVLGRITKSLNNSCYRLKFAKYESIQLLKNLYSNKKAISLRRKHLKFIQALGIINKQN